jgi:hypothetical protein
MLVLIASCGVRADGGAVAHEGLGSKGQEGQDHRWMWHNVSDNDR